MSIEIQRGFFKTKTDVLNDIKQTGFWPTTNFSRPKPTVPVHWHSVDVQGYIFEGEAKLIDDVSNHELRIGPGDKFTVCARTLHAECEAEGDVLMILALPEPGPLEKLLEQHTPEEL